MKKQATKFTTSIALFILLIGITVGVALGMAAFKTNFFGLGKASVPVVIDTVKQKLIAQKIVDDLKKNLKFDAAGFMNAAYAVEQGKNKAFTKQVFDLGTQLDNEIAKSLALTPEAKEEVDEALKANYPNIADSARTNYLRKINTLQAKDVNQISCTMYRTKAEILAASLNSLVSSLSNLLLIPCGIHLGIAGNLATSFALQSPVETILAPVMQPIGNELYKLGLFHDLQITQARLRLQRESALAEIATSEVDVKVEMRRDITRHINIMDVNIFNYEAAHAYITYDCAVKFGFDLTRCFRMSRDDNNQVLSIDLPESQLIDLKLEPVLSDINSGLFGELQSTAYQDLYQEGATEAVRLAEKQGVKDRARVAMQRLVGTIFFSFVNDQKFPYRLEVNFINVK